MTEELLNIPSLIKVHFLPLFFDLEFVISSSLFASILFNFMEYVLSVEIVPSETFIDFCVYIKGKFVFRLLHRNFLYPFLKKTLIFGFYQQHFLFC